MKPHKFIISDESINSHGFVFLNADLDFSQFKKNPVCLFMHNDFSVILGRWSEPILETIDGRECWTAELTFDEEDKDEQVQKIIGKVERGFLKAVSLGAIVRGGFEKVGNSIFAKKGVVHEISLVTIGSNRNAVKLYHEDGQAMQDSEVKLSLNQDNQNQNTNMTEYKDIAVTLGLAPTATATEINDSIAQLQIEKGYKEKFEALEKKQTEDKKKDFVASVDLKISQNAVSATEKDEFVEMYDLSAELAHKQLAKRIAPKDLTAVAGVNSADVVTLSGEYDTLEKEGKLAELSINNPTKFKELYKSKFGVEPEL